MGRYQKISAWLTGTVAIIAVIVTVSFQNCGKAGFDAETGIDELAESTITSTKNTEAPFAFQATFDQISYMSCIGGDANKDAFYSVKAGGYENGGLKISDAFMSYAKGKLPVIYPETTVTISQLKQYLSETPANVGASPQLSMRLRTDLRSIFSANGSSGAYGVDYFNILIDPTDDRIMDPLFRYSGFTNYFGLAPSNSRIFESKLNYGTNEASSYQFRKMLRSQGVLALTYADSISNSDPRGLQSTFSRAYGRGYILDFRAAGSTSYAYATEAAMYSVREMDLLNSTTSGTWACAAADQFKIVRIADRAGAADYAGCPMDAASRMLDAGYRRRMERVRRHLKAEYWDVSIDNACAVPKMGECYSSDAARSGVEYRVGAACYDGVYAADGVYGANPPLRRCAQYVSFCFRQ